MATKDPDQKAEVPAPAEKTATPPVDPVQELEWLSRLQKERLQIDGETEKKINKLLPSMTDEIKAHAEVLKALAAVERPADPVLEPEGRKLENLADCRKALKFIIRRIENGSIDTKKGGALVFAINFLAGLYQDRRDSVWTKRAALLWAEREKMKALHKGQTIDVTPQLPAGEPEQEH